MNSIPYMGSKRKLADKIVPLIQQRHPDKTNFYDLFGGGGAISFMALKLFKNVHYNEFDTAIVNLVEQLKIGIPDYWYDPVNREKFFEEIEKNTAYAGMIKTCWSFGNNKKDYLWGDCAEDKLLLHELCVKNTTELIEKARKQIGIELPEKLKGDTIQERRLFLKRIIGKESASLQSLERFEYLESLTRLQSLQSLQSLQTSNKDYREVEIKPNSVVYCDPPYNNTATYKGTESFNHKDFYKWALSVDFPIYISEYDMPKDFEIVAQYSHRSTLSPTNNGKKTVENLYWNGKGNPLKTTLF